MDLNRKGWGGGGGFNFSVRGIPLPESTSEPQHVTQKADQNDSSTTVRVKEVQTTTCAVCCISNRQDYEISDNFHLSTSFKTALTTHLDQQYHKQVFQIRSSYFWYVRLCICRSRKAVSPKTNDTSALSRVYEKRYTSLYVSQLRGRYATKSLSYTFPFRVS